VDAEGNDATNELSFAAIDATMNLRTLQPALTLRYHDRIDPRLIDKAADCIASGMGMPSFFNDETVIDAVMRGAKERLADEWSPENERAMLEAARNWASIACVGGGMSNGQVVRGSLTTMITSGVLNFLKCLEYVLYQGVEPETGEQIGCRTADPRTFTSYDEFLDAYLEQIRNQIERMGKVYDIAEKIYEERTPRPFESLLLTTPILFGRDGVHRGEMSVSQVYTQAPVNAGDSLAVIKKLVFDERSVSMEELIRACAADWKGYERLQQQCLRVPKFGNDDDYVDLTLADMYHKAAETIKSVNSHFGTPYSPEATLAAGYFFGGIATGATPDGRNKRETVSDGQLSPMRGRDVNGPTAVLKSCSKVKVSETWNQLLNQKLSRELLNGKSRDLFAAYLRTWYGFGNWHIQFNCHDIEDLKDAQIHPKNHAGLVVRVAGYSACFTDLTRGIQNDIIDRTEQQFVRV
jgi:formate C-acetyltransferase